MSSRFAVQITEAAEVDLRQIIEAVAERASPALAEKLLDEHLDCVSTPETFPDRGSVPSELAPLGIKDFGNWFSRPTGSSIASSQMARLSL